MYNAHIFVHWAMLAYGGVFVIHYKTPYQPVELSRGGRQRPLALLTCNFPLLLHRESKIFLCTALSRAKPVPTGRSDEQVSAGGYCAGAIGVRLSHFLEFMNQISHQEHGHLVAW